MSLLQFHINAGRRLLGQDLITHGNAGDHEFVLVPWGRCGGQLKWVLHTQWICIQGGKQIKVWLPQKKHSPEVTRGVP